MDSWVERSTSEGIGYPLQYSWASLVAQMVKNPPAMRESWLGSIPVLERFPGGGRGNPLQHSCLENPVVRGAWRATVQRDVKSRTRLSDKAETIEGHRGQKQLELKPLRTEEKQINQLSLFI